MQVISVDLAHVTVGKGDKTRKLKWADFWAMPGVPAEVAEQARAAARSYKFVNVGLEDKGGKFQARAFHVSGEEVVLAGEKAKAGEEYVCEWSERMAGRERLKSLFVADGYAVGEAYPPFSPKQ